MLENLLSGAAHFADLTVILSLFAGVVIGVVIGAIPGMSTVMAVAVALPFTFVMAPIPGILLLVGVYKGGMYGGSISAILINTPGTPAASCTMLDGYPLAQQGRSRFALQLALYASVIGDMIANIWLILLAAWLARFALRFGPPEQFVLIVFALTVVASVAGNQLLKGAIAAITGLLLATIGTDLITGSPRFTFDVTPLRAGVSLVPVLIGLFAIPEIIRVYMKTEVGQKAVSSLGHTTVRMRDMFRYRWILLRGSLIGLILGVIPGLGATPAAFLSYSETRRTSLDPQSFGCGNPEGVVAAEVGNSSVGSATMIPLLALGIPGDLVTAVILGAFMVHGLTPGPLMFQENITIIYALFIGLMVGSLFLLIIGQLAIPVLGKLCSIRASILLPSVLIMCVYGAYAVNNSIFDILVMFIMGIIGFAMTYYNFPRTPLLIAFVLGPLLENNFRQGLLIGGGNMEIFFRGPITWMFWALTLLSLAAVIASARRSSLRG